MRKINISKLGLLMVILHLLLAEYFYREYFSYPPEENWSLLPLVLLDFPAILIIDALPLKTNNEIIQRLELITFASIQWYLIGWGLARLICVVKKWYNKIISP